MLIKGTFFNKSQKKASQIGQILGGFFRLFLVGFFWLAFFRTTLDPIDHNDVHEVGQCGV